MGVQLGNIIPKHEIKIEALNGKIVAIDASNILYQFLSSIRQQDGTPLKDSEENITSHLVGLSTRIPKLMSEGLRICFVLDGKSPELKGKEQEDREIKKLMAEEKLHQAKELEDVELMHKYSMQTTRLSKDMIKEARELMEYFGLPVIQAPSEAEAQAAFMTTRDVYAIVSQDYDSLLFGAVKVVRNLTISQRKKLPSGGSIAIKPEIIYLEEVLDSLGIKQDQLIVMGILIGTDFNNKGVKGIGPKNALKLIKQHKDYGKLFKSVNADFDWKEIYDIFKKMPVLKDYKLKWGHINEEKIKELLIDKHDFSKERVDKIFETLGRKTGQSGLDRWF
ncbi:flap endonuclease-1 [Candidatus Woesearchaeota archaeon]|nr:flap endonuclease-1 [Candidatus Woesearchaeota archaeon]